MNEHLDILPEPTKELCKNEEPLLGETKQTASSVLSGFLEWVGVSCVLSVHIIPLETVSYFTFKVLSSDARAVG